ncbi:hypothetical protein M378DRAFT_853460 [Amanita muscaria Koide BX008]|uniref:Uncharacterized protein n=1 Tax=Amanita muscaria (strain Koide BX008) TaxID=946122 RepID=A0A0C2WXH7_AMAMK|nr:hypothetical protein M378DRAFT_853460 [Amanita muscaria Koide BX008]
MGIKFHKNPGCRNESRYCHIAKELYWRHKMSSPEPCTSGKGSILIKSYANPCLSLKLVSCRGYPSGRAIGRLGIFLSGIERRTYRMPATSRIGYLK